MKSVTYFLKKNTGIQFELGKIYEGYEIVKIVRSNKAFKAIAEERIRNAIQTCVRNGVLIVPKKTIGKYMFLA